MPSNVQSGPRLNVRAVAELLSLPAYAQMRILHQMKYPKQAPQVYRAPYYAPSLTAIRDFHAAGNSQAFLDAARHQIDRLKLDSRKENNHRVLNSFEGGGQYLRQLKPRQNRRFRALLGSVEIRLSADFVADENGKVRTIFYHWKAHSLEPELAKITLEIAHWVLGQNEGGSDPRLIEFVDVTGDRHFKGTKGRPRTIKQLHQNAKVIDALWKSI
jgi:hypothetical protein